jgi:hypothetical protein
LGHASHLAAATHRHAALRQAGPAQQDDAEIVWAQTCAWVSEIEMFSVLLFPCHFLFEVLMIYEVALEGPDCGTMMDCMHAVKHRSLFHMPANLATY